MGVSCAEFKHAMTVDLPKGAAWVQNMQLRLQSLEGIMSVRFRPGSMVLLQNPFLSCAENKDCVAAGRDVPRLQCGDGPRVAGSGSVITSTINRVHGGYLCCCFRGWHRGLALESHKDLGRIELLHHHIHARSWYQGIECATCMSRVYSSSALNASCLLACRRRYDIEIWSMNALCSSYSS